MPIPPVGPLTGIFSSYYVTILAEDGGGHSLVLPGVQGDPAFGDELPDQRAGEDVYCRGSHVTQLPGQEQTLTVTWSALRCEESDRFVELCLHRGTVYGSTGTSPAVSVDLVSGRPCVKLTARWVPPGGGPPKTIVYARAYLTASPKSAANGATWDLSFDCYGRTES